MSFGWSAHPDTFNGFPAKKKAEPCKGRFSLRIRLNQWFVAVVVVLVLAAVLVSEPDWLQATPRTMRSRATMTFLIFIIFFLNWLLAYPR
jgi:hypothetical protein